VLRKYIIFLRNKFFGLNSTNCTMVFGRKYFYNEVFGLASLQRIYCASYKLKELLPNNPIIVDVGANIGQFNFFCRHYLNAQRVISIEPVKSCYELLKLNSAEPSDCTNFLVCNENELKEFYLASESSQLSSCIRAEDKSYSECLLMQGKRLDDILAECGLQVIDLLKIDTEGSEFEVLRSAERVLETVVYVLVEMSVLRKSTGNIFKTGAFLNARNFELVSLSCVNSDKPEDIDGIFMRV
jgi:FkbM family methyltransferase